MELKRFLPIMDWLPQYRLRHLRGDFAGGLTVAVMLVPQGMAYGLLAGLPPIYGLYAGIVPLLIYAVMGTSRQLSVGPVALVSLVVLSGLGQFAEPMTSEFIGLAVTIALLTGLIQVLLGIFKAGFLVNFLSHPVISGFTSAAALIIAFSQMGSLLGVSVERSNKVHEMLYSMLSQIGAIHWMTLWIGLGGLFLMLLLKRWTPRVPGALLTIVLGVLLVSFGELDKQGVAIVGEVPAGLPHFTLPLMNLSLFGELLPLALTICLISFIESMAIAKSIESRHKTYKVKPDQELIALGVAKIGGAFFQSFPTTGSFSRSAVNDEAGAQTGMASIISALIICLTLLFLTPLFYFLPKTLLSAIILLAVRNLIDFREAVELWRNDKREFLILIVTFISTIGFGIMNGIFVGVILSLAIMIYRNSKPHIAILGRLPGTRSYRNVNRFEEAEQQKDIIIFRFDAQLYFGNAEFFRTEVERLVGNSGGELKLLVLDASSIHDIDSSGIHVLKDIVLYLKNTGVKFYVAEVIGPVRDILYKTGLMDQIGKENQFLYVHDAIAHYTDDEDNWSSSALQTNLGDH